MSGAWSPWLLTGFLAVLVAGVQLYRILRVNTAPIEGDAFTYLRVAREVVSQRRWFPELRFYYTGEPETLQLPPLLMWLLAPVANQPYRVLIHLPFITDLLIAVVVYLGGTLLFGLEPWRACLGALIVLLAPINLTTSASLTPRSLGLLWLTGAVAACAAFAGGGPAGWVGVAAGATALALLSQRMVTQVILILFPVVGLALAAAGEPRYLVLPVVAAAGLLAAWAVTGGVYGRVLADHWRRVRVHMRIGQQERQRLEFGHPLQILKANPWPAVVLAGLALAPATRPEWWLPLAMIAGLLLLAVFWVMGNSVNHVFFAAPFVAWLVAVTLPADATWLALAAAMGTLCALIAWRELRAIRRRHLPEGWRRCYAFIRDRRLAGRVLVVPQVGCPSLIYYTPLVLLASGHGAKALTFDRLTIRKALADPQALAELVRANDIGFVLLDRARAAEGVQGLFARDGGAGFTEVFAAGDVALFRCNPQESQDVRPLRVR